MRSIRHLVLAALAAAPLSATAAAPLLKVQRSVIVHATPAAVWATVGHFDRIDRWHPGVAKDEIVAGRANQPGAVRVLTLRDGSRVREKLLAFDPKHHRYSYAILDGALPVSGYTAALGVKAAGPNRVKVTWSGTFRRKDPGPHPAADADDVTATRTMDDVYRAGLDHLKTLIETAKP
ncbi:MAG: SRPBCC family protein [Rhodanobacteraceae bacterium]|jgi:mxaD protein|nr:SRPBCC family protein [Rhodanobacteraceae bacterium]